jgi:Arc-like DNA binding domain
MEDVKFTLRLPRELLVEVEKRAAENERTASAEIRLLIRRYVGGEGPLKTA